MADIFLSYARADREAVERLAAALEAHGFSIWWDRRISSGAEFSAEIERELNDASAVVVCWSAAGVKSFWVKDEATIAARLDKLKAVSLDGCEPPIGFMQFHALDLSACQMKKDDIAVAALADALGGGAARTSSVTTTETPIKNDGVSLVILPFRTMSAEPADDVLAVAIHEDLTAQLARTKDYFVISSATAAAYGGKPVSPSLLRAELGVAFALEGSVRRAGDDIRISAQLIDTKTGRCEAALRFDRPSAEILPLQNDLIGEIVTHLGSELNLVEARRIDERAEANPSAVGLSKRAGAVISQTGWNRQAMSEAIAMLEQAAKDDPDYAPAIAQLSLYKSISAAYGLLDQTIEEIKPDIMELAERAIRLDNQSSDVLGFAGCALCDIYEYERGGEHLLRAVEINPSNAQAHAAYGWAEISQGRAENGVRHIDAAVRISPKQPGLAMWQFGLGVGYARMGKFDAARESLERTIRLDPRFSAPYVVLAAVCVMSGAPDDAKKALARAKTADPAFSPRKAGLSLPQEVYQTLERAKVI